MVTSLLLPLFSTGQNLSDNEAIKIDAAAINVTITDVDYHVGTGTFTISWYGLCCRDQC